MPDGGGAVQDTGRAEALSPLSRGLTAVAGLSSAVTGAVLFLAGSWAAPRFAWAVTDLMVMSIGAWFVGNAVWSVRIVRTWRWAVDSGGLVYLWAFGSLQTVVLLAYRDKVVTDTVVARLYLLTIALLLLAAVVGVVDLVRLRPLPEDDGPPMSAVLRGLVVAFVAFVGFLFLVAMLRPSAAAGGRVYPEPMSPFTLRSFGVYFLALLVGAAVVVRRRALEPFLAHVSGGLGITVAILVASLVHLEVFSFGEQPWQWVYLGSYVVVLAAGLPIVLVQRHRLGRPTR